MRISGNSPSQIAANASKAREANNDANANGQAAPQAAPPSTVDDQSQPNREINELVKNRTFNSYSGNVSEPPGGVDIDKTGDGLVETGTEYGDNVKLNGFRNYAATGDGNDVVELTGGDSTVDMEGGGDFASAVGNNFTIYGGSGGDFIKFDGTRNVGNGGADGDTLVEDGLNNTLYGDSGGDTITQNGDSGWAFGGLDGDLIVNNGTNNASYGQEGNDVINITEDAINGSAFGGADDDVINLDGDHYADGGSGDDVINVSNGSGTVLTGGAGDDTLNLDIPWTEGMTIDPAPNTTGSSFIITSENGEVYAITEIEQINFSNKAFAKPDGQGGWTITQLEKQPDDGPITDDKVASIDTE